jgi:hypothetical protein
MVLLVAPTAPIGPLSTIVIHRELRLAAVAVRPTEPEAHLLGVLEVVVRDAKAMHAEKVGEGHLPQSRGRAERVGLRHGDAE